MEMKHFNRKGIALSLMLALLTTFHPTANITLAGTETVNNESNMGMDGIASTMPEQVFLHVGDDAAREMHITYTTGIKTETIAAIHKVGETDMIYAKGTSSFSFTGKYFHTIEVENLSPNTRYEYTLGETPNSYSGTFKTALDKGSSESFRFGFIADTQVSDSSNAKSLGATLAQVKDSNLDLVYLAGDVTDSADSERQWELLFKNSGTYPTGGQDLFGNTLMAVAQGNHDNSEMYRHINAPAQAGDIVYSFDYGCAKFIILNLETAKGNKSAKATQTSFLRQKVSEARSNDQWVIVGFHKSLYSGASHIVDTDIIDARSYWAPILADLNVDLVLQGHDHVYSRGFVSERGMKVNPIINNSKAAIKPLNAPLYVTGGHAGGLKWYSQIRYYVSRNDPLTPRYTFLDVNSTDNESDLKKEQVFTEFQVSPERFTMNAYMFKYDPNRNSITTDKYLYDSITVYKAKN